MKAFRLPFLHGPSMGRMALGPNKLKQCHDLTWVNQFKSDIQNYHFQYFGSSFWGISVLRYHIQLAHVYCVFTWLCWYCLSFCRWSSFLCLFSQEAYHCRRWWHSSYYIHYKQDIKRLATAVCTLMYPRVLCAVMEIYSSTAFTWCPNSKKQQKQGSLTVWNIFMGREFPIRW